MRRSLVELHRAAEEIILVEPSKHDIGVGYGRLTPASPIGRRPGNRARAAGADSESAAVIDIGNRSTARTDRVDVDHRQEQRKAGDGGAAGIRLGVASVDHKADIRARAANVEGDQLAPAAQRANPGAAEDARRQPREQGRDRFLLGHRWRRDAAVRGHDAEVRFEPCLSQRRVEPVDISPHLWANEGAERRGREALGFAELRRHRLKGNRVRTVTLVRSLIKSPPAQMAALPQYLSNNVPHSRTRI
jgi:hypothetical protein